MGWWTNRRERKRKEREEEDRYWQDLEQRYWTEVHEWNEKRSRAQGKAELAAEKGDGNTALAWLKLFEELDKHRPSYPHRYY